MSPLPAFLAVLSLALFEPEAPVRGHLVDARSGSPVAGAEITIVGRRGSVRTDAAGRFQWPVSPLLPIDVIVVLRDGRVARPIRVAAIDSAQELTLAIDPAESHFVTVLGVAPSIDASPAESTTVLTKEDLDLRHAQTLSQALEAIPGVGAISDGQSAVPAIRGLARGRTLIMVDGGHASTERRAGANASFLDPGTVTAIEVARGPGSVAYGSDAFGGVIVARTRGPDYGRPVSVRFAGTAGRGVPERRADLEISTGYGSGGLLIGLRARDFGDYHAPAGVIPNSGWRDRGLRVRWETLTDGSLWSVGWQSDLGRSLGRPRSDGDVILATSPFEDSHRLTASYRRRSLGGFRNLRLDALAGATRQRTEQDRLPAPSRPRSVERTDLSSREVQVRLTGERAVGRARLHVGADLRRRDGLEALDTSQVYNLAGAPTSATTTVSIDSARRMAGGLFAEAEAQVARVRLSGGIRVDRVRNTNEGGFFGDRSVSNTAPAGLVAATLAVTPRLTLTGQVARGFRDPTLSDRFYRGPIGRGFIEGNPDLTPETSLQFDVTARYLAGPIRLVAAAYHYRIARLVERYAATPTLFLFRNRGRAELLGAEIEAEVRLPGQFALTGAAEASRGRDGADGTALDDVAPAAASATLRHRAGAGVSSYVRVRAVASHHAAGPSEVPTGHYTLADAGVSWRLTRQLELRGAMRNLLDDAYQSSAGPRSVWAPGRHGSVTIVLAF